MAGPKLLVPDSNNLAREAQAFYVPVNGSAQPALRVYGSVDGQSKLVYDSEPEPEDLGWGILQYIDTDDKKKAVAIASEAQFNQLCNNLHTSGNYGYVTVGSRTYCLGPRKPSLVGVKIGNKITAIPARFLYTSYNSFNGPIIIPESVTSIGNYFMCDWHDFNQPITFPKSITSIGGNFFRNCNNMTSVITVECPASAFPVANQVMAIQNAGYPAYVQGMPVRGTNGAALRALLPNISGNWNRKLIA